MSKMVVRNGKTVGPHGLGTRNELIKTHKLMRRKETSNNEHMVCSSPHADIHGPVQVTV